MTTLNRPSVGEDFGQVVGEVAWCERRASAQIRPRAIPLWRALHKLAATVAHAISQRRRIPSQHRHGPGRCPQQTQALLGQAAALIAPAAGLEDADQPPPKHSTKACMC